jgi:hypothetical protein
MKVLRLLKKNQHRHSAADEESRVISNQKIKRGDPSALRPQDDCQRLIDKYQRKDNPFCHSERSEESHTFIEFLTPTYA